MWVALYSPLFDHSFIVIVQSKLQANPISNTCIVSCKQTAMESKASRGLKGARKLQFGGLTVASATTGGKAASTLLQNGLIQATTVPTDGLKGSGTTAGTSFGSSTSFSPGLGNSQASGAANGASNSTAKIFGGIMAAAGVFPEQIFGEGFGNFAASGGGSSSFGSPLAIPGTGSAGSPAIAASGGGGNSKDGKNGASTAAVAAVPASAPVVIPGIQTGGGGGGFGFTLAGGIGNVSGADEGYSQAYGSANSAGFGSAQGTSLFGTAGGNGGGTSIGNGGGSVDSALTAPTVGLALFNGTGGGTASGGAGGFVGINPNTPVIFGNFALGP
jgi:hypothetical protein